MGPCHPKALLLTHKSSLYYSKVLGGLQDIFGKHKTSLAVLFGPTTFPWIKFLPGVFLTVKSKTCSPEDD